ncbi:MAG: hypothetical protein ACXW1W_03385 [Methylococcaceae bacterium]
MISAIVMIFAAIWIYRSGIKVKTNNLILWIMICMGVFIASQVALYFLNSYLTDIFDGRDVPTEGYERDVTSVGDRKNAGGFQSVGGAFFSVFLEFLPAAGGFLIMAVMRLQFITKESYTLSNLFSGITEIFQETFKSMVASVKEGFKKTE